jgi:signal transduction histidine kinase
MTERTPLDDLTLVVHELVQDVPGLAINMRAARQRLEEISTGSRAPDPGTIAALTAYLAAADNFLKAHIATVQNFKAYLRVVTGKDDETPETVDVWEIVQEAVAVYETKTWAEHDLRIATDLRGFGFIFGCPTELRSAILNLLSNAVKYSFKKVPDAEHRVIHVTGRANEDQEVRLTITNLGTGILPDECEAVKTMGRRGALAIADGKRGTGLGLALVARVAHKHRGSFGIVSSLVPAAMSIDEFKALWKEDPGGALRIPWKTRASLVLRGVER